MLSIRNWWPGPYNIKPLNNLKWHLKNVLEYCESKYGWDIENYLKHVEKAGEVNTECADCSEHFKCLCYLGSYEDDLTSPYKWYHSD